MSVHGDLKVDKYSWVHVDLRKDVALLRFLPKNIMMCFFLVSFRLHHQLIVPTALILSCLFT